MHLAARLVLTTLPIQSVQSRSTQENTIPSMLEQTIEEYNASLSGYVSLQIPSLFLLAA